MKNIPKVYIAYAIGIIVLLIVVMYVGGALADGIRKIFGVDDVTPPSEIEIEAGNLTEAEHSRTKRLAVAAHEDMSGVGWNRDMELWRTIISLPDEEMVGVYNYFNAMFFQEKNGTMYQWIMDEWGWQDPFEGIASRAQVAARMQSLNLL